MVLNSQKKDFKLELCPTPVYQIGSSTWALSILKEEERSEGIIKPMSF